MILASQQDGSYPRPQLVRGAHHSLDGPAGFAYDDDDRGLAEGWQHRSDVFDREILLPFAPESPASGIGDTGYHAVVWYRIELDADALRAAGQGTQGDRLLLHFGAVDHAADVWVDGTHVARHEGGQTAFAADITEALAAQDGPHSVVVRAHDDPLDVTVPRGKQDWLPEPHAIWYHRQTGIWRTVWLEAVPRLHLRSLAWTVNPTADSVRLDLVLSRRPETPVGLEVTLAHDGTVLTRQQFVLSGDQAGLDLALTGQHNGQHYESLLWTPESPQLVDAELRLGGGAGSDEPGDEVASYLGLRTVGVGSGRFLLNDRPRYVRSVLEQGYWPGSHFTAPSLDALRAEVELIKSLGFDAARIHQKVEDPRFLYWCDRLGLMIWGETAGAYEFSTVAVGRLVGEWTEIVATRRSHPCIVTWVPLNESWGVQHGAHEPAQRAYGLALTQLTRALDPSRPVISNDGWEHTDSDVWTIHDYESSGEVLRRRYGERASIDAMIDGIGPAGRRISVLPGNDHAKPVMLTEFGGVSYVPGAAAEDSWGYSTASDADDLERRLTAILQAVTASEHLSGFCYTQLTDTRQETNGLCDEDRVPKLPAETLADLVRGRSRAR